MSGPEVEVLVVVQEALLAGAVSRALSDAGCAVHWSATGQGALEMARRRPYSVFVVELVLTDMLGLQLVQTLRSRGRCSPVLLLGARSVPETLSASGPPVGALPKPFTTDDLVRGVHALLPPAVPPPSETSRATSPPALPLRPSRLVYDHLEIDTDARAVSRNGRPVSLTDREFAVLDCLMRHPEEVVSKAELAKAVWGSEQSARSNVLEVYMNFLRRKIDHGFDTKLLHTVRGAGYVLRAEG